MKTAIAIPPAALKLLELQNSGIIPQRCGYCGSHKLRLDVGFDRFPYAIECGCCTRSLLGLSKYQARIVRRAIAEEVSR